VHLATPSKSGAQTALVGALLQQLHSWDDIYTVVCGLIVLLCKVYSTEHSNAVAGIQYIFSGTCHHTDVKGMLPSLLLVVPASRPRRKPSRAPFAAAKHPRR